MMRKLLNTDPETFRGKLYLLVLDKVVIGAMIAIALFAYKRWETNDQRAYEDRTTLAFQRAGYVKELVPMVVDSERSMSARSQALIALIETGSVSDNVALGLTGSLLRQGLIRSDYPQRLVWNHDHPLIDALAARMPSALEPLFRHHLVSLAPDDERPVDERTRWDIKAFWRELFIRAVNQHDDSELALLNRDEFLNNHLWVMEHLVDPPLHRDDAKAWFSREPKALRILAALSSVGEVGVDQHRIGREYLLTLVSPSRPTAHNLRLAGEVIRMQEERQWVSKALATRCLEIYLRQDEDEAAAPDYDKGSLVLTSYESRALAAGSYIEWYAKAKRDEAKTPFAEGDGGDGWAEIQPAIVAGLKGYLSRMRQERVEPSDFETGKRNSIALPLARILLDGIERGEKPSEATRQLLTEMASLSDERLSAFLLDRIDLRQRVSKAFGQ